MRDVLYMLYFDRSTLSATIISPVDASVLSLTEYLLQIRSLATIPIIYLFRIGVMGGSVLA